MAADIIRPPRDQQQSSELYRWAMLRIAVNEDKCTALTNTARKHKRKTSSKEVDRMWASLFRNLPTLTTVRKWRAMVGGDVRRKYGGRTEWDSCLTDSAYLMYGIPRAKLRKDVTGDQKGRQNGTGVAPRRVNYSQSFSSFDCPREQPRHIVQLPRIPSNPSVGASSKLATPPSQVKTNGCHQSSAPVPLSPAKPARHRPLQPMPEREGQARFQMSTPAKEVKVQANGIVETPRRVNASQSFSSFDCRPDLARRVLPMSRIPSDRTLAEPSKTATPTSPAFTHPPAAPPLVAPVIPVRKRPPQPMPKPKKTTNGQGVTSNKYNLTSLQVALMGSLNKRLKAHSTNHQSQS